MIFTISFYGFLPVTLHAQYPLLVKKFYEGHPLVLWMNDPAMRNALIQIIDSSANNGLQKDKYHVSKLHQLNNIKSGNLDSAHLQQYDRVFTDAAITFCKDLYQGAGIKRWLKRDEWSGEYEEKDNNYIITRLSTIRTADELNAFINSLIPTSSDYAVLQTELKKQSSKNNTNKAYQVATTMNFYRWIYHFSFERLIVVNVAATDLNYYENNTKILFSKMIVGKLSTRTPRFTATCNQVILYPYWNVPRSIVLKELLPKAKRSPGYLDRLDIEVIAANGNVVSPYSLNWSQFSSKYFPYRLRQATGCNNSLGVIKFDLTDPFGVYLHDTNAEGLFNSNHRYYSHGCMRVEKAIELGNYILNNKLDTAYLQKCLKDQKPTFIRLDKPVPVFVIYNTAEVDSSSNVIYNKDTYHLF
jgi:murein L,D-transpeptidase YcbB/YkuD